MWTSMGGAGGRRWLRRQGWVIVGLEIAFGANAQALQQPQRAPTFHAAKCTAAFGSFEDAAPSVPRCGTVTVPQNRAAPHDTRLVDIVLPVVVFEMPGATGTPLVFLAGGPGESSIEAVERVLLRTSVGQLLLRERPIIAFDRRGVSTDAGRSNPDLGSLSATRRAPVSSLAASLDSAKAIARRLREHGVDVKYFGTPDAVEDIRDVGLALGYHKLVLFGVSYGTRDALVFVRRHPDMVDRMILDGVAPPQAITLFDPDSIAAARRAVVRQVGVDCAADVACNAEYPNLIGTIDRLARIGAPPLHITANLPSAGGWRTIELDPGSVLSTIGGAAGAEQIRAIVPQLLEDFASGDTLRRPLSPDVVLAAAADSVTRLSGGVSLPLMYHITVCTDMPAGPMLRGGRPFCDALGVPFAGDAIVAPVTSDVPVLLLSSGYDSQTPPGLAAEAARTLPHSHRVLFRMVGHIAFGHTTSMACAAVIVQSFMTQPERDPATACLDNAFPSFLPRRADITLNGR